jgi:S1-C subfamily serine protease
MLSLLLVLFMTPNARADEGFWLFNEPPLKQLQEKYHFTPDAAWLEHIQKSSVRFNSGGSGSFVSADGLVITNQHVGVDALQKNSVTLSITMYETDSTRSPIWFRISELMIRSSVTCSKGNPHMSALTI